MRWPFGSQGKRPIFLCHGCFDLLHVGHLEHLMEVRHLASKVNGLVYVTVTSDACVNKGPGRPLLPAEERAELLRMLRCVDRAEVIDASTAVLAIERFKPLWYCKGLDYQGQEHSDPQLVAEIAAVRKHGGELLVTSSGVRHSTDYLARHLNANRC